MTTMLISWLKSYKKKIYEFKDIIVIGTDNMLCSFLYCVKIF